MKPNVALAVLLLALLPARAADTPDAAPAQPTAQERLAVARQAVAAQNWNAALRQLQAAVREAPQDADVHNLLGYAYRKQARPDLRKAVQHYELALKYDPAHRGAREYLGEAYLMEGRLAEAEQQLSELQRLCGGSDCEEYRDLAQAIAGFKARRP